MQIYGIRYDKQMKNADWNYFLKKGKTYNYLENKTSYVWIK